MKWASESGFDVPECRLVPFERIVGLEKLIQPDQMAFAIKRYDRSRTGRVHQEDFAQVLNLPPSKKYDSRLEEILVITRALAGESEAMEVWRRFFFTLVSGNFDAHLKNWSFIYPDRKGAKLSPLYDQVAVVEYPEIDRELALKFCGTRTYQALDWNRLLSRAQSLGFSRREIRDLGHSTLRQIMSGWNTVVDNVDDSYRSAVETHWKEVAILEDYVTG